MPLLDLRYLGPWLSCQRARAGVCDCVCRVSLCKDSATWYMWYGCTVLVVRSSRSAWGPRQTYICKYYRVVRTSTVYVRSTEERTGLFVGTLWYVPHAALSTQQVRGRGGS